MFFHNGATGCNKGICAQKRWKTQHKLKLEIHLSRCIMINIYFFKFRVLIFAVKSRVWT